MSGMSVAEVGQVIRACPDEFLATVRPLTAHKKTHPPDVTRVNYVTVIPIHTAPAALKGHDDLNSSSDSLADVGDYDDEELEEEEAAQTGYVQDTSPTPPTQ